MKDINGYTGAVCLVGVCSTILSPVFLNIERWPEFLVVTLMIIMLDLFPIRFFSGDDYSANTLGFLYLLFDSGLAACMTAAGISVLVFHLKTNRSLRKVNWFRYFTTLGMYFISALAAYEVIEWTAPLHLFIRVFLASTTYELVNILLLSGVFLTTQGIPFFHNFLTRLWELVVPVAVCVVVLPRILFISPFYDFLMEILYVGFFIGIIIYFTIGYMKQIHSLKELNQAYERFVPAEFLRFLKKKDITEVRLGDQIKTDMTILFSDIRAFTTLSEQMTPEENFRFLNSYFRRMEPIVNRYTGFIDKYIGDAVMALFHTGADDALKAAVAMLEELKGFNQERRKSGAAPVEIGIGLNSGSIMLGIIGGDERMESTVISDTVNLASRMEGLNKNYGTSLLISEFTFASLRNPENFLIRRIDKVRVKGKSREVAVYEVFDADPMPVRDGKLLTLQRFNEAYTLYLEGRIDRALLLFEQCLKQNPEDPVLHFYLKRCRNRMNSSALRQNSLST